MFQRARPITDSQRRVLSHLDAIFDPRYLQISGNQQKRRDPSGLKIWDDIQSKIERYAPNAAVYFEKVAVTEEQIVEYDLPTRPTKIARNTHAKDWNEDEESVEVDALPVDILQDLVRDAIEQHIDQRQLQITKQVEESERAVLSAWRIPVRRRGKK